ncbi:restriction endonuclease subunit S [Morganella morganii]|uniref:restriction endonuclease subunit S n=1 Tax=Morganella morganii TaxID=582 RepID=UPI00113FC6E5|nr:restriction endonuclease subunit S [Morganella morganii]ELJ5776473.1 restriction endonuclease subunit S [Morganella morganii]MBT0365145.1 restriction endonuclease subunit S [Morganella morganii subsp. morganii]TPW55019.1 restriction endonuclease subunit S [Morganella morganii]
MSMDNKVPEIRFKGFSVAWDKKILGDLVKLENGFAFQSKYFKNKPTKVIVLTPGSVNIGGGFKAGKGQYYDEKQEVPSKYVFKPGEMFITMTDLTPTAQALGFPAIIPKDENTYLHNQRLGKLVEFQGDLAFLYNLLRTTIKQKEVVLASSGTTVKHTSPDKFLNRICFFPKKEEQTTIGNYFQKLDMLINQHQQKHDKLNNIKKAMLEKMFPKPGETIPEIRFKGFSGAWEEKSFGVCFVNVPNNTLSRADLNYKAGLAKNIHYGDVLIKFGEILDAGNELLPFITNDDVVNKLNSAALRDGDIIIADAAEDSTVGKCTELFNVDEQLIFSGLHTIAVRPILSFASKYLGYYINSSSYHDQLVSLMQGTKVLSISKTAIQNTNVKFPKDFKEQAAIGNYFQKLDTLINQHQQQITKLNNIKQACLSKMFV